MTTYHKRGFNQNLIPRFNSGLYARMKMIDKADGLRLYNDENTVELETNEIRGPEVNAGDELVLLEYVNEISVFFLIKYYELEKDVK